MAPRTIYSNAVTFVDYTDSRKLEIYIASNRPTVQIYDPNNQTYSPDWSKENLKLTATVYLDSKNITEQATITWSIKGVISSFPSGKTLSIINNNDLSNTAGAVTYLCEATYNGITAWKEITFTRISTGKNGTGVNILGSYDTVDALKTAHPTGNAGEAYLVKGNLYVWNESDWINAGNIQGPQGNPGESAKSISLSASSQIFKVSKDGTISPETITVKAQYSNTTPNQWQYSTDSGEIFLSNPVSGVSRDGDTVTITGANLTSNSLVIKASDGIYSDSITIYKVFDGADGTKGDNGTSASIVFLTNENITFNADERGQIPTTSFTTNIVAYNGDNKVSPTIGTISGLPEGMTVGDPTNLGSELSLVFSIENNSTLGSATSNSGTITIPVTSPVSTNLKLAWSKINTGLTGEKGNDAVVFQIYSSNGYVLSKDVPSITLQTFAYIGDIPIEAGATYQWYRHNDTDWEIIADATYPYLNVSHTDVSFSYSYMCKMTFNGVEYVGVVTIDDKNNVNTVFSSKPSSYMVGDIWVVGEDYVPNGVEIGTVLKTEHTSDTYSDEDWVTATKYDKKIQSLKDDIDTYNKYFSFDTQKGLEICAKDEEGKRSKFSTALTHTQLSLNYDDEAVAYIGGPKMHIKEAEIESPLTVTGKYSGNTMIQAPVINLGAFSLIIEGNGSFSIISNL